MTDWPASSQRRATTFRYASSSASFRCSWCATPPATGLRHRHRNPDRAVDDRVGHVGFDQLIPAPRHHAREVLQGPRAGGARRDVALVGQADSLLGNAREQSLAYDVIVDVTVGASTTPASAMVASLHWAVVGERALDTRGVSGCSVRVTSGESRTTTASLWRDLLGDDEVDGDPDVGVEARSHESLFQTRVHRCRGTRRWSWCPRGVVRRRATRDRRRGRRRW